MGKIIDRRMLFAKELKGRNIPLDKSWFALSSEQMKVVKEVAKLFGFRNRNVCRNDGQQFYYAAQSGAKYMN